MALPADVTKLGEFKGAQGDKGETGTFVHASATVVPAGTVLDPVISGPQGAREIQFFVPQGEQGLPGLDAVPTGQGIATHLTTAGPAKDALTSSIVAATDPTKRYNEVRNPLPAGTGLWSVVAPDTLTFLNDPDLGPCLEVVQVDSANVMSLDSVGTGPAGRYPLASGQRIAMTFKVKAITACRVFARVLSFNDSGVTGAFIANSSVELAAGQVATVSVEAVGAATTASVRPHLQVFATGTTSSPPVASTIRSAQWTIATGTTDPLPLPFMRPGQEGVRWEGAPNASRLILDRSLVGKAIAAGQVPTMMAATTVMVPSTFPTLQAAVDYFVDKPVRRGHIVEIRIEPGHRPTRGVVVRDGDYSMFRITSADAVVTVAADFAGDFIRAERAQAPRLACLVDMIDRGETGYHLIENSSGFVEQYKGVRNALGRGLYVGDRSACFALRSEFTGAGERNVWVTRQSQLDAELSNFSANKGGDNAVYISRSSSANLEDCKVTDAFLNALCCTRSWVTATGADLSRAKGRGLIAYGHVNAGDLIVVGCGSDGVYAEQAASVAILRATITGNGGVGIRAQTSARVDATAAAVSGNTGHDLFTSRGSFINAGEVKTTASSANAPAIANANVAAFNALSALGAIFA